MGAAEDAELKRKLDADNARLEAERERKLREAEGWNKLEKK